MTDEILNLLKSKERELTRLGKKISDAEIALSKLKQDRAVVEGEKNAFAQAAKIMGHTILSEEGTTSSVTPSITRLDEDWVRILHLIYSQELAQFGYEDVMDAGIAIGKDLKKPSVRTQILSYVKSGVLDRIVDGKFCFSSSISSELKDYKTKETPNNKELTSDVEASEVNSTGGELVGDGIPKSDPEGSNPSTSTDFHQAQLSKVTAQGRSIDDEIPF